MTLPLPRMYSTMTVIITLGISTWALLCLGHDSDRKDNGPNEGPWTAQLLIRQFEILSVLLIDLRREKHSHHRPTEWVMIHGIRQVIVRAMRNAGMCSAASA
jgi:hypothetical protein